MDSSAIKADFYNALCQRDVARSRELLTVDSSLVNETIQEDWGEWLTQPDFVWASLRGHLETVLVFLEFGVDVNICCSTD
jgi:hypothetical protein